MEKGMLTRWASAAIVNHRKQRELHGELLHVFIFLFICQVLLLYSLLMLVFYKHF